MPSPHDRRIMSKIRIESFSDNVFSIILTLLVFNFKVPQLSGPDFNAELYHRLLGMHSYFVTYAMSFVLISLFWVAHHNLLHDLQCTNSPFLWLNNLFLFCLVFIAFPTQVLGTYPDTESATVFFGCAMIAAMLSFSLLRYYAYYCGGLVNEGLPETYKSGNLRKGLWGAGLYSLAIAISAYHPDVTLSMYALIPFLYFLYIPGKRRKRQPPKRGG